jgi:cell wall-associated NlpC family hydrolase
MIKVNQKAAKTAKAVVRDNAHGYDNRPGHRLGNPDFACSSFVAYCYRRAGVPVPINSYTQCMKKVWKEYGFKDVAKNGKVNLRTGEGLHIGDVVVAPGKHTAIVVPSKDGRKLANARHGQRGHVPVLWGLRLEHEV